MATQETGSQIQLDPKYDHYEFPTISATDLSGHPGHTTKEQDDAVKQLRTALEAEGYTERLDTITILRFLRARKFNVEASKKMFVDCENWRKEFGTDKLVNTFEYPEKAKVFEFYPQYYHKTDKDGRPVYIEQYANIDLNAMYKITTAERMLQNLVYEYEKLADPRLPACSRMSGHLLETCCTIMDLKGVGLSKIPSVYGFLKQVSAISQNYYPERLGKLYLINAPWGFSSVFSFVKSFLDPVTVQKIHVLGSGYQAELLAQVPKENLPKQFGGSCECSCDGGCAMSDAGPWQDSEWATAAAWKKMNEAGADAITNKPDETVPPYTATEQPNDAEKVPEGKTETVANGAALPAAQ